MFSTTVVLLGIGIYLVYASVIYPLLFHPLRKIPRAHWSVAFPYLGSLWILYRRYRSRNNATTYQAHLQGGTVVRLAYNELSVNCVDDGIRTIYGGGWIKHEWYPRQFASYGIINMFSTIHRDPHSQKKRTMANIYSKSNLQSSPQMKANSHELLATRFLPCIQRLSDTGEVLNVHELNNAFTMDFMSAYLFGIRRSTNFTQDVETRREIMHHYHMRRDYEWHASEISPVLAGWLATLKVPFIPKSVAHANDLIEDWNRDMCVKADGYLEQHPDELDTEDLGNEPVVYRYFKTGIAKLRVKDPEAGKEYLPHIADPRWFLESPDGAQLMSKHELMSEMLDHLGAGHETSGITLTYLFWELSKNPHMQERLHTELCTLQPQIEWPLPSSRPNGALELPEPKAVDNLPYLHAVLMEVLRLHAPIPGTEPRISPHVAGGSTLGSFSSIPGGVRVSSMPYTLHRNTSVFPEPENFIPDRWLTGDEEKLKEMHRWFWAFGSGGRMCIGSNLAIQEIKLLVAAIYTNWTTEIVDDEGIEEIDAYTTRPRSNKLMLKFLHRSKKTAATPV